MQFDAAEEVVEERIRDRNEDLGRVLSSEDGIGKRVLGMELLIRSASVAQERVL
jgi:hypothetical protein